MTIHSKTGASSAERWMVCPGSVALIEAIGEVDSDEPEYRQEGTIAHDVAAQCLKDDRDAWEFVGPSFDVEGSAAVQVYVDLIRDRVSYVGRDGGIEQFIEEHLSDPARPTAFGTVDHALVAHSYSQVEITDYKHGVGIAVDVEKNPQLMYYAYLFLLRHPEIRRFLLRIVQPRGFHPDGPVREWEITADDLAAWAETELFPSMDEALIGRDLVPGRHCRFCPGKLRCGALGAIARAAAQDHTPVDALTDEALAGEYAMLLAIKFRLKAIDDEVYKRMMAGADLDTAKLVAKKADRIFKPEAEEVLKGRFGVEAYTTPKLKSPAQIELLPGGKVLTAEWAYAPHNGYTVAPINDSRKACKPDPVDPAAKFGALTT